MIANHKNFSFVFNSFPLQTIQNIFRTPEDPLKGIILKVKSGPSFFSCCIYILDCFGSFFFLILFLSMYFKLSFFSFLNANLCYTNLFLYFEYIFIIFFSAKLMKHKYVQPKYFIKLLVNQRLY